MLVAGSLLLGVGIGMFVDNTGAGALVGLGAGLILEYVAARGFFKYRRRGDDD